VVLVGVVGMEIPRDIFYEKELEFIISNSYGPGRKDPSYEENGNDYPFGYVRWTEKRNMESFLDLLSEGKLDIQKIISHEYGIKEAHKAYEIITGQKKERYMGIILSYNKEKEDTSIIEINDTVELKGDIGIGWIGAGSFATTTLLPAIRKVKGIKLIGLSAGSGISTKSAAENYGFEYCTSDYNELLNDERIKAVVITTRNSLHAQITQDAVKKGKHVFVEKPLAINKKELTKLIKLNKEYPQNIIQVGFNRRYAPMTRRIIDYYKNRNGPMIIHYRINAGKLPKSHWVYEKEEGGSRFISELCHFIDYCRFITGEEITFSNVNFVGTESMDEKERMENLVVSLAFKDGSIASIIYNSIGESETNKEYLEIQCEGSTIKLFDFRELQIIKSGKITKSKDHLKTEKGHMEELEIFIDNIKNKKNPFNEYIETTKIIVNE
jgi:predicted dehydrogenase